MGLKIGSIKSNKIGNTIWYVATVEDQWLALLSFSAPALKCSARDAWIGWGYRHQYDRLNLVAKLSLSISRVHPKLVLITW